MKIIDFEKKGNVVRFYLGKDDLEDWGGDDWNDKPYEHNAGLVDDKYIVGYRDIAFPFDFVVVEPQDGNWNGNSDWCKDDMKERKIPCIVAMLDDGDWDNDRFMHLMGNDNATKFYFGDTMQPTTIVKKEEDATA